MATPLLTLNNISLSYGLNPLLEKVELQIFPGERVCLIGRNGAGKSSLLKVLQKVEKPDHGDIWYKPGLRVTRLDQEFSEIDPELSVFDLVAQGLEHIGQLLMDYDHLSQTVAQDPSQMNLQKLAEVQQALDAQNGWQLEQLIQSTLQRLQLDPHAKLKNLSGGWQRRALLAKALVIDPDILLLDEPTNHLDIETIQWLERELLRFSGAVIFITHDRALLKKLATRILELDRGQLTSWPCTYDQFFVRKEEQLQAEAKANQDFDKKLAEEERWIRQGIKARRTRNEGRVRALKQLRLERSQRRERQGNVQLKVDDQNLSGELVIEAQAIFQAYQNKTIIDQFSIRIMRGDRIGLIGPNGAGKSTLLNILLGKTSPQKGVVKQGSKLNIAYFDQMRAALDPEKTVVENISQGHDFIQIGQQSIHVMSYLKDFLFTPERARTPVKALSGGECNRLLLANLFSQPTNLLVLDEPTNDLDIETLELLEELLLSYQGTLLLVSHDRDFLDKVVTSVLVFKGNGKIEEFIGGYQDLPENIFLGESKSIKTTNPTPATIATEAPKQKRKLSNKEQRELEQILQSIELLENEQAQLTEQISSADFYSKNSDEINKVMARMKKIEEDLLKAYARWEELSSF